MTSYMFVRKISGNVLAIHQIRKSKNRADVKNITKKINKTSGTSFDEGYMAVNISQLLDKLKPLNNVKTPQKFDFFHRFTIETTSEDNLAGERN